MLSRSQAASSIDAAVWNEHAAKAFKSALNNCSMTNVKQLNVTDADDSSVAPSIYTLCPDVKVQQHLRLFVGNMRKRVIDVKQC